MPKNDKLDRILAKFESASRREAGISDTDYERAKNVWMASYKTLGDYSARIILASTEPITKEQARIAVPELTEGEMNAYVASFTQLPVRENNLGNKTDFFYASVYAVKPMAHFKKADESTMESLAAITATQYLDVDLQQVWDKKEVNGEAFLVRVNENNPEEILKTALMASTEASYRMKSDDFIVTHAAKPGDFVQFFSLQASVDNTGNLIPQMDVATVESNNGDNLEISITEDGYKSTATISAHAVNHVITASEGTTRQDVMDYLYKAFGDNWKEIVKQTGAFGE